MKWHGVKTTSGPQSTHSIIRNCLESLTRTGGTSQQKLRAEQLPRLGSRPLRAGVISACLHNISSFKEQEGVVLALTTPWIICLDESMSRMLMSSRTAFWAP